MVRLTKAKMPDWAMSIALPIARDKDTCNWSVMDQAEAIARALLAAEGLEKAAEVADADDGKAPGGWGNPDFGPNVARRIAAAIRSLGEKP